MQQRMQKESPCSYQTRAKTWEKWYIFKTKQDLFSPFIIRQNFIARTTANFIFGFCF